MAVFGRIERSQAVILVAAFAFLVLGAYLLTRPDGSTVETVANAPVIEAGNTADTGPGTTLNSSSTLGSSTTPSEPQLQQNTETVGEDANSSNTTNVQGINSSLSFENRCGVAHRLTEGNVVSVSTTAEAQQAINSATPGTVIRLSAGSYSGGLSIDGINGTADKPIVIETADGAYRQAVIENAASVGVRITNSSHIHLRNLQITNARFGVLATGLTDSVIENLHVHDLIWKAIQVSAVHTGREVTGRASSNVDISCNLIHDTGIADGYENGHNGEGIYIGSGFAAGDRSGNVTISYNEVFNTTGEAIELKPLVTNAQVLFNKVYDVTLVDEGNGGAIAAQLTRELKGFTDISGDPNIEIRGNRVWNVSRRDRAFLKGGGEAAWRWSAANALRLGGPATVTENVFWNTRDAGIKIQDIYGKGGLYNEVEVSNNIVFNASINPLNNTGAIVNDHGVLNVELSNNLTEASSNSFAGPTADNADEGRGLVPNDGSFSHLNEDFFW